MACPSPAILPRIHLPISATSKGLKHMARIEDLPLLRFALPSFIASAEPESFHYAIDIGADSGDVWYDNAGHQARIVAWWNDKWQQQWGSAPCIHVSLRIFIYNNTHSRNSTEQTNSLLSTKGRLFLWEIK